MVVHDLHAVGVAVLPDEADAPLVVDADAVLPRPVALQRLEPVAGRHSQRIEPSRGVKLRQLAPRHGMQCGCQPAHVLAGEHAGGILVREGLDHRRILTLLVTIGKRHNPSPGLAAGRAGRKSWNRGYPSFSHSRHPASSGKYSPSMVGPAPRATA